MSPLAAVRSSVASQRGSALPVALLTLLLLTGMGFALVTLGMTETTIAGNWRAYSTAFYGAEAGLESGVVGLRALLASTPKPTPGQLATITAPTLSNPKLSFVAYSVAPAQVGGPTYAAPMPSGAFGGLTGLTTDYMVTSQVRADNGTRANLTQTIRYVQVPLFQFGVFYGKGVDLEIAPGAPMTFNGKIFANSNIYLGPQSSLQINSLMATAGNIYRRIKRDPAMPFGGNPLIENAQGVYQTLNFDHDYKQNFSGTWLPTDWQNAASSLFGGTVKDSAMGVGEIIPPIPELFYNPANPDTVAHQLIEMPQGIDSPDLAAAKLYSQAGLRIVNSVATDQNGTPVSLPAGVITTTSFFDAREQTTMAVTQVDIGLLAASGRAPANGVLYVANTIGGSTAAVRLTNGVQLPSQGLSVVSPNPVYIRGDYNTVNKVPAAVMADAITVLSNNWGPNNSDAKGTQPGVNRPASNTTVNAAFMTGPSAESVLGQGNGQLENDIRFLENWSGQTFTYAGSLVDLWHSQQVTRPWSCCTYYSPPNRNWSYDTMFNTNPPPGTPMGIIIMRGPWARN